MKDLQDKMIKSLLTSVLLAFSFTSFATEAKTAHAADIRCSSNLNSSKLCAQYVRGYLDALQQLNQVEQDTHSSTFEERAFRTRVGLTNRITSTTDSLEVCLPNEISDSELKKILASRSKELPMDIAVLKVIQAKYPC